ncbi:hypothetical protein TUM4637_33690 [Shewanella hafniensis]|nr:hypothetical protein TUM4637_33690 [Shewanella hafniensis]
MAETGKTDFVTNDLINFKVDLSGDSSIQVFLLRINQGTFAVLSDKQIMACAGMRYGVFKYIEVDCCLPSRHSALGNSNVDHFKTKSST